MREEIISKMKNSETIGELNSYLIQFLNTVEVPEQWTECDGEDYIYSLSDDFKLFEIKKYRLYNWWSDELSRIGIPVLLSDYPKIEKLVNEYKDLNKTSSEIHKKFNSYRKAELKRIKSESAEFQNIKSEQDDIIEQIRLLEEKRHQITQKYINWIDNVSVNIEKEYGFINPNIKLAELSKKLK